MFALNKTHKLFRDGRLFRIGDLPLQETLVEQGDEIDRAAREELRRVIDNAMSGVDEPPLVGAFGEALEN